MPRKYTPAEARAAFWSRVDKSGGPDACWPWTTSKDKHGYGRVWEGKRYTRAHRRAHELENGAIPDGIIVCHSCDNPRCCNPAHLWLGTHADNAADRDTKGRSARGEAHGARRHPDRMARGEAHGRTKLTAVDVAAIRAARSSGFTYVNIGRMFSISQTQARNIALKLKWKHLE